MNTGQFFQYLVLAWENLTHRKKRAYLTIIGVFIGIMAVVALVSLGQGLEAGVEAEFQKLGTDKIFVSPQTAFGGPLGTAARPLTEEDLQVIRRVKGASEVTGTIFGSAKIEWGDEIGFYYVVTMPKNPDEKELAIESFGGQVDFGRQIESGDTYKAVIGNDYTRRDVFAKTLDVGSTIEINDVKFTVVGIRKRIGNPEDDRQIFISESVQDDIFPAKKDTYDYIMVRVAEGYEPSAVANVITEKLRNSRGLREGDEDFNAETAEDLMDQFGSILLIIQVVLTGIAAISLVVGGVGITNTMYTAVLERTKEIGVMKAIGATNEAILTIFLLESGLLGLIGGAVGVTLGLAISYGTTIAASAAMGSDLIQFYYSWWLILGAMLFGFIVGGLAGFLPARQAAKMNPVDSLRYE